MDPLTSILNAFPVSAVLYCRLDARDPWGVAIPKSEDAYFHAVRSGRCWVRVGKNDPVLVEPGEFVVLPRGHAHDVLASREAVAMPLKDSIEAVEADAPSPVLPIGGQGPSSTLLCGALIFANRRVNPLLQCLPDWIHLRAEKASLSTLEAVLDAADREIDRGAPALEVVLARLADIVIVEALRTYLECVPASAGLLAALADKRLGTVLGELHADPARQWSLDDLANVAGMSRSSFTSSFRQRLGESPQRYLARWRLAIAAKELENSTDGLKEVARRAGYTSTSAFSRAFAREFGVPPAVYRRKSSM